MTTTPQGARFGRVAPIDTDGLLRVGGHTPTKRIEMGFGPGDLENGAIKQVSPEGAFQPGQQVLFYLTVYNSTPTSPAASEYISKVRLKPWWKRVSLEMRGPGDPGNTRTPGQGWISPDELQYGTGPVAPSPESSVRADNNRLVWFPVPKILDITQYQTPPPPAAPARQSDSLFLDDVWTLDLQDPSDPAYAATKGQTQPNYGRSAAFLYISHGTALGLTYSFETSGQGGGAPELFIDLTWITGTL